MMINLKKSVFAVLILMSLLYQKGIAQTQHEVGFRLNDFKSLSVLYKKQKDDTSFMRYRLNSGRIFFSERINNEQFMGNIQFAIGKENRKQLREKLLLIHGIESALGLGYNAQNGNASYSISPTLGYILGVQYTFFEQLVIGIEAIPSINAHIQQTSNRNAISFGLDFQTAGLTIGYRFEK